MAPSSIVFNAQYHEQDRINATHEHTIGLSAKNTILIRQFGDLGLRRGEWAVISHAEQWDRAAWPMPAFGRVAVDKQWAMRVEYAEDSLRFLRETPISIEEARRLPEDGLSGYGALEIRLTKLLSTVLSA